MPRRRSVETETFKKRLEIVSRPRLQLCCLCSFTDLNLSFVITGSDKKTRHPYRRNMHALFSVCSLRDDNVIITSKPNEK